MKIDKNTVVALDYEIWNTDDQLLDKMKEIPIYYLHGEYDDIFRKVENELDGKSVGDEIDISLTPDEAFGEINPELIQKESLQRLADDIGAENIQVGMVLEASSPESDHVLLYRITDIADDMVVLDANPPLAGQNLRFKAKVIGAEPATEEQIAFGSANLPHEHHDGCCSNEEGDCNCH
ncbi:peptidylprolyl isomerase [Neisseriaceae bacterium PsAf]|nr:peptidylprolyl isomerase [Neisseriaceae bacterium PsAf]